MSKTTVQPKLCPTCWHEMRSTDEGYVCPKHGLAETRPERVLNLGAGSSTASKSRGPRAVRRTRAVRTTRAPNQTDRLNEKLDEIVARNQAGESLASIAADLWRELGYKSAPVCASKISRFLSRKNVAVASSRSGPPPGTKTTQRFTVERFAELTAAVAAGEPVGAFAGRRWEEWGFASRSSCDSLLRKWLRKKEAA